MQPGWDLESPSKRDSKRRGNGEAGGEGRGDGLAGRTGVMSTETDALVSEAVEATQVFAEDRLLGVLERAVLRHGANGALHRVIAPLAWEIGERWRRGQATAAHEHFASELIRDFLRRTARPYVPIGGAASGGRDAGRAIARVGEW